MIYENSKNVCPEIKILFSHKNIRPMKKFVL